jgi:hypothetical protein
MSYDIELKDGIGDLFLLPHVIEEGGTYQVGGSNKSQLNITFNYGKLYQEFFHKEGLCWINGKRASETNSLMTEAVKSLGVEQFKGEYYGLNISLLFGNKRNTKEQEDFLTQYMAELSKDVNDLQPDILRQAIELNVVRNSGGYWKATPGNAGHALNILLQWGLRYTWGTWSVHS